MFCPIEFFVINDVSASNTLSYGTNDFVSAPFHPFFSFHDCLLYRFLPSDDIFLLFLQEFVSLRYIVRLARMGIQSN